MSDLHRYGVKSARRLVPLALLGAIANVVGCSPAGSTDADVGSSAPVGKTQQSVWVNGDFENSDIGTIPNGWTLTTYRNAQGGVEGLLGSPPDTFAKLRLGSPGVGVAASAVIGGAPETQLEPSLGLAGSLRLPKYGQRAMRVNETGLGYNANSLSQSMIASLGDVDPLDDKVHVRFAVAPVLNNPQHGFAQQPYYFVQLRNVTRNTNLYTDFNVSAQDGVPWKTVGAYYYTDWQLVDISPGNAQLAVGDEVQLTVVASNCSQGGPDHFARLYVDAVGSGVPGLYSWATGPQLANAGDIITYTVNYKNGGRTLATLANVEFVTPPNTTFSAVNGAICTHPLAGTTGAVNCPVVAIAPGGTGSFTVAVKINANATGSITNGNYSISALGVTPLIGPKVITAVTAGKQYADVGVTMSDGTAAIGWGKPTKYTAVVTNHGSITAPSVKVMDSLPAELTNAQWTCVASPGSSCGSASGMGSFTNIGSVAAGGTLTYTIDANVVAGNGAGSIVHTMNVTVGGGVEDPNTTNNAAVDTNAVGTLRKLTLDKPGLASAGSVNTAPAAIACTTGCSSAEAEFLEGSQVVLTAAPAAGATFAGWGGDCSGSATTCTITLTGDKNVSATFVGAPSAVSVSAGGGQSGTVGQAFGTALAALVTDAGGTPVPGAVVAFTAPAAGATATLSAQTATTNAAGIASLGATANTVAGSYAATASVSGIVASASFGLTNLPGAAASLQISSAQSQAAKVHTAFAAPLEVTLKDSFGNLVPGKAVSFTAPGGPGATATLSSASATSDASGKASITATAGAKAGLYSVQAQTPGVAAQAFSLTNTAGEPASLHYVSGASQTTTVRKPFAADLVVRVEDADGNTVPSASVSFEAPANGASAQLSAGATSANALGLAKISATASPRAGSYAITATVAGGQGPVQFAMSNEAAAPASIVASQLSADQSAAADLRFVNALEATVYDADQNPVPNKLVTFSVPANGSTAVLDATTATTDASGKVSVGAVAGTQMGSFAAEARTAGVAQPASFLLRILPSAPSELVASVGSGQSSTVLTAYGPLTVRLLDRHGNPVEGVAIDVQLPAAGASASIADGPYVTNANGEVKLYPTANGVAGTFQLIASVENGAAPIPFTLTNVAGAAASFAVDNGGRTQAAVVSSAFAKALTVHVTDAQGNPVAGKVVQFAAPLGGATAELSALEATTDANGDAIVHATASEKVGSYTIVATIDGMAGSSSFELTNTNDAPAHLVLVAGGAQHALATTAFAQALEVRISDAHDNPVPALALTVTVPSTGSSVQMATTATTDAEGAATFTMTANDVPGAAQLAISAPGILAPLTVDLMVQAIDTRTSATMLSNVLVAGIAKPVQLTVSSDLGTPAGIVTVMEGAQTVGTAQLESGAASFSLLYAVPGTHLLTAVYEAQGAYAGSRSFTFMATVEPAPTKDDDDDHGTSSSSGSVNNGSSSGGSSSGASGANGTDDTTPGASSGAANSADPLEGITIGGGSGCSVGASPEAGYSSLGLGLAALLVMRRRQRT